MPFDVLTIPRQSLAPSAASTLKINVRMPDGGWLAPPAVAGARLVDALAAFGLPLRNVCSSQKPSVSCRARVGEAWRDRLDPPSRAEAEQLAAHERGSGGVRLLCHLVMTSDLDGLEIELDWDALEPQHYWIAG